MRMILLISLAITLRAEVVFAQPQISGTVTSEEDLPLVGATLLVKPSLTGTITDLNGQFTLTPQAGDTIVVVSYAGYIARELPIGLNDRLDVRLEEDVIGLSEVVVTGYGTQRRIDVSAAISSVAGSGVESVTVAGIDGALQGKVPGLLVTSNSGQPGAGMSVRIRGNSSITAGNEPLYLIDGIPVTSGDFSEQYYGLMDFNVLNDINPDEIASIDILKDAAAASIYGSRASNGVVLITTKQGTSGKPRIRLHSSYGVQSDIKRYDMLDGETYTLLLNEVRGTSNEWNGISTDFVDLIYQNGSVTDNGLSISGGDDKTRYYLGGSLYNQEGTIINQRFRRISGRLNLDHRVSERLGFHVGINLTESTTNVVYGDNDIFGTLTMAIAQAPNVAAFREDGSYNFEGMFFEHPVASAREKDLVLTSDRTLANLAVRYQIASGWSVQTRAAIDKLDFNERNYKPETTAQGAGSQGIGSLNTNRANRFVNQNTIDYQHSFGGWNLSVLSGMDYENFIVNSTALAGTKFPSPEFRFLASAAEYSLAAQSETENSLIAFYSRVRIGIADRFLVTTTLRADGSSKFGDRNRFGYFPSASIGWRISNERFLQDWSWLDECKWRLSFGQTGNQAGIGNFSSRGLAAGGANYNGQPGIAPSQLPNPDLKWESTTEWNTGIDLVLFGERVGFSLDLYHKKTKDLLLERPMPTSSGFGAIVQNVGEIENKGFELALRTVNLDGPLRWVTFFQLAHNDNKVLRLYRGQGFGVLFINRVDEGRPIGYFSTWKAEPFINPDNGDVIYEDVNGDGQLNNEDNQFVGSPHPDFIGGLDNTLSYRGLELNFFFNFVTGNEIFNNTRRFNEDGLRRGFNNTTKILERWQQPGDVTDVPVMTNFGGPNGSLNNQFSSRFLEDGSYLRLKFLSVGYRIPKRALDRAGLQAMRIYLAGENLLTWTKFRGLDPEANFDGTDNLAIGSEFYTQGLNRTFKVGLDITL